MKAFHAMHHQMYGHAFTDVPVEIVNLRVKAFGRQQDPELWWDWGAERLEAEEGLPPERPVYFREAGGTVPTKVVLRRDLRPGVRIDGPAVVHQVDSTILVPPHTVAEVLEGGGVTLAREGFADIEPATGTPDVMESLR